MSKKKSKTQEKLARQSTVVCGPMFPIEDLSGRMSPEQAKSWQEHASQASQIEHTPECIERQQALDAWLKRWPNYCKVCGGRPIFIYPATQWEPGDEDWCENCIGSTEETVPTSQHWLYMLTPEAQDSDACFSHCPRCMEVMRVTDDRKPCPNCDWNWGKGKDDCPPETDCYCYEQADEDAQATLDQILQDDNLHFGTNWQAW